MGIHVHNDAGCAVANSLIAVENGAFQVQGVVNGYGERTGNADLIPIAANLVLKMDADCLPDGAEERLTEVAHFVAEVANLAPDSRQPYAGRYAFTHKAGLHASGVARLEEAYEHVRPTSVGNRRGIVASDLGGAATLRMKAEEFGVELPEQAIGRLVTELKDRESRGYTFEVADASLELLMRRAGGWEQAFFTIESFRVHIEQRMEDEEDALAEATVKVVTNGTRHIESAEGHGPVGALDNALRKALTNEYPALDDMNLEDYRVRVLDETVGHRRDRARPDRHVERRARVDHGGRVGEHHRGLVGGARRRLPVRLAPSPGGSSGVSSAGVVIREATSDDARAIAEVHVASWRWAYRGDLPAEFLDGLTVDDREREWREWLTPEQGAGTLVALEGGVIVGFCSFGPSRDDDADERTAEVRRSTCGKRSPVAGSGATCSRRRTIGSAISATGGRRCGSWRRTNDPGASTSGPAGPGTERPALTGSTAGTSRSSGTRLRCEDPPTPYRVRTDPRDVREGGGPRGAQMSSE